MNRIVLNITPQTWVKINSSDYVIFNIPEECFKGENGGCCDDYFQNGTCKHVLSDKSKVRKRRLEKYNKYRLDLYHIAKQAGFKIPSLGMSLYFHFPMPVRWSKVKKKMMAGQMHLRTPDYDNCLKSFNDALTGSDNGIGQISGSGKFWTPEPQGFIEILVNQPVYNPYNVEFINSTELLDLEDVETRREKRRLRKEEIRDEKKLKKINPEPAKPKISQARKHKKTDILE